MMALLETMVPIAPGMTTGRVVAAKGSAPAVRVPAARTVHMVFGVGLARGGTGLIVLLVFFLGIDVVLLGISSLGVDRGANLDRVGDAHLTSLGIEVFEIPPRFGVRGVDHLVSRYLKLGTGGKVCGILLQLHC